MRGPGEQPGEKGRLAVRRAKVWLDKSTRVAHSYTSYDQTPSVNLLTFTCPGTGGTASFDIGGTFRGEDLHDKSFLIEVKDYGAKSDQYSQYKQFLALCYIAYAEDPKRCDNLIYITWRPFKAESWDQLTAINEVVNAVVGQREVVFGKELDSDAARAKVDLEVVAAIVQRLWLIVLTERQEQLVITRNHYGIIMGHILAEELS